MDTLEIFLFFLWSFAVGVLKGSKQVCPICTANKIANQNRTKFHGSEVFEILNMNIAKKL